MIHAPPQVYNLAALFENATFPVKGILWDEETQPAKEERE